MKKLQKAVIFPIMIAMALFIAFLLNTNIQQGKQLDLLTRSTTDCTLKDSPAECRKKQFDRNDDIWKSREIQLDCLVRRISVGLPAPEDPNKLCTEQTPREVYPGVDKTKLYEQLTPTTVP